MALLECGVVENGAVECVGVIEVERRERSVVEVMIGGVPLLLWLVEVKGGISVGVGCPDPPS